MNLERVTLADDGSGLCAFLLAAYWFTPVSAAAFADQRHGLSQTLAGVDACHGSGADRPRLDTAGAATVSGATVVTASGGVKASHGGGKWQGKVTYRDQK
jgi:imidazolonepropionase-like amidohydrolase